MASAMIVITLLTLTTAVTALTNNTTGCLTDEYLMNGRCEGIHSDKTTRLKRTKVGSNVYLQCDTPKTPTLSSISWYFYSEPSSASVDELYLQGSVIPTNLLTQSKIGFPKYEGGTIDNPSLFISYVVDDDAGYYVCAASNRDNIVLAQEPILVNIWNEGQENCQRTTTIESKHLKMAVIGLSIILTVAIAVAVGTLLLQRKLWSRTNLRTPNWIRKSHQGQSAMNASGSTTDNSSNLNRSEIVTYPQEPSNSKTVVLMKGENGMSDSGCGKETYKENNFEVTENTSATVALQNTYLEMLPASPKRKMCTKCSEKTTLGNGNEELQMTSSAIKIEAHSDILLPIYSVTCEHGTVATDTDSTGSFEPVYNLPSTKPEICVNSMSVLQRSQDEGYSNKLRYVTDEDLATIASSYFTKQDEYMSMTNLRQSSSDTDSLVVARAVAEPRNTKWDDLEPQKKSHIIEQDEGKQELQGIYCIGKNARGSSGISGRIENERYENIENIQQNREVLSKEPRKSDESFEEC